VNYRYDDDGSLILDCRLPAEAGAKIVKALEIALEQLPKDPPPDVPAGTSAGS
jgi:FixJ family two-component response regulator